MSFMSWIITRLNEAGSFFYSIYLEVIGWPWPFYLASDPFYSLALSFFNLASDFWSFSDWVNYVQWRITDILDSAGIWGIVVYFFPQIEELRTWFYSWWDNVTAAVIAWWSYTQSTVQGWISSAIIGVQSLIAQIETSIAGLRYWVDELISHLPTITELSQWWSDWAGHVLTVVNTWWSSTMGEIQGLIDSAFTVRESLWAGWQDLRDQVVDFFEDPEQWLYNAFDRIIMRFW